MPFVSLQGLFYERAETATTCWTDDLQVLIRLLDPQISVPPPHSNLPLG
jgi:hypothetical protein